MLSNFIRFYFMQNPLHLCIDIERRILFCSIPHYFEYKYVSILIYSTAAEVQLFQEQVYQEALNDTAFAA